MIETVFDVKNFLQDYGNHFTGHSKLRSFHITKQNDQIVFFYKSSSLALEWKGLNTDDSNLNWEENDGSNLGIILFHTFPNATKVPSIIEPVDLDTKVINGFLLNEGITRHFSTEDKNFFVRLFANSRFYFEGLNIPSFPGIGLFWI